MLMEGSSSPPSRLPRDLAQAAEPLSVSSTHEGGYEKHRMVVRGPGVCLHAQIYGSSYVPPLHLSFLAGTQSLEIPSLQFVKIKQYAACKMLDT